MIKFDAIIQKSPDMDATYIDVPLDISNQFKRGILFVKVTFDGEPYEGCMMRWATTQHMIGIRKDIRKKIGKNPGDSVKVIIHHYSEKKPKP